jgi:hypothetical protein
MFSQGIRLSEEAKLRLRAACRGIGFGDTSAWKRFENRLLHLLDLEVCRFD